MSYDKFRRELINDNKDCIFENVIDVPKQEEVDEDTIKNEQELYKAIRAIHYAKVESDGDHYRISIFARSILQMFQCWFILFTVLCCNKNFVMV